MGYASFREGIFVFFFGVDLRDGIRAEFSRSLYFLVETGLFPGIAGVFQR